MFFPALIVPLLLAVPALSTPISRSRSVADEQWTISTFSGHFMGDNSGIGDGSWPEASKFLTTLSFTLNFPDNSATTCTASFKEPEPGTPVDYTDCGVGVRFKIAKAAENTGKWALPKHVLEIVRMGSDGLSLKATKHIAANNLDNPDTYLTCISAGRPFSGIICTLDGSPKLGLGGPVPLDAVRV